MAARCHLLFSVSISRRSESVFVYSSSQRPPYCGFIMFYYKAYLRCSDRCNTVLSTYLSLLSVSLPLGTCMATSWSSNMFAGAYQFNVHQLAEVFHGLSEDADVHELEQVFLKVPGGFFRSSVGLDLQALLKAEGRWIFFTRYLETYTAGGCDNAAGIVSCLRGWGPPIHSLSAPC